MRKSELRPGNLYRVHGKRNFFLWKNSAGFEIKASLKPGDIILLLKIEDSGHSHSLMVLTRDCLGFIDSFGIQLERINTGFVD